MHARKKRMFIDGPVKGLNVLTNPYPNFNSVLAKPSLKDIEE